jgi:hypothetical protein
MSLNQPANRGFVKNFETYIEYARRVAPLMRGSENAALSNLGRNKTLITNAVYFFPKLKMQTLILWRPLKRH